MLASVLELVSNRAGDSAAGRRTKNLVQSFVTALGGRALGVLIGFISLPLTVHYLGAERYGAWVAVGSLLSWLSLTDFGFSNGLNNALTTAAAENNIPLFRTHVSNYLVVMTSLSLGLGAAILLAWPLVNWGGFLGVKTPAAAHEVSVAVLLAACVFLVKSPLAITSRVLGSLQMGRIANYWGYAGAATYLAALLLVVHSKGGLPLLVLATSGLSVVLDLMAIIWLFYFFRPDLRPARRDFRRSEVGSIANMGLKFFALQIMALVTFQTDTIVIAHFRGAAAVPVYSVTLGLFSYAGLGQTLLFGYLWTAYNDAIARGDIDWAERAFRRVTFYGTALTALGCLVLIPLAPLIIKLWIGPQIAPSLTLRILIALWTIINAFSNPVAGLLAAGAYVDRQLRYSLVSTIANLAASIYFVTRLGAEGVIGATVVAYSIFVCIPIYRDAQFLFRKLRAERAQVTA